MNLAAVGFNYRTAPVEVRERLHWPLSELPDLLSSIRDAGASGVAILTTCNRTEFYLSDPDSRVMAFVWKCIENRIGPSPERYGYVDHDREAATHLFRVAAGLDSMLLGESQIQGQVRDAWEASRETAGPVLSRLFQSALTAGGRVRAETGLGEGAGSIPGAAVSVARKIFGDLGGRKAIVFGSGEMGEMALASLVSEGVRPLMVTHKQIARAERIAEQYGTRAVVFDDAWQHVAAADIVISSTAAPGTIITTRRMTDLLSGTARKPLCILDIAVPRDVEEGVGRLPNVYLYDIDDLQSIVAQAAERRKGEIPRAENIIEEEVARFWEWYSGRRAVGVIKQLRSRMDEIRKREFQRSLRRLAGLDDEQLNQVEHLTHDLMQKFLHEPTIRLKEAAVEERESQLADALAQLFDLNQTPNDREEDS